VPGFPCILVCMKLSAAQLGRLMKLGEVDRNRADARGGDRLKPIHLSGFGARAQGEAEAIARAQQHAQRGLFSKQYQAERMRVDRAQSQLETQRARGLLWSRSATLARQYQAIAPSTVQTTRAPIVHLCLVHRCSHILRYCFIIWNAADGWNLIMVLPAGDLAQGFKSALGVYSGWPPRPLRNAQRPRVLPRRAARVGGLGLSCD